MAMICMLTFCMRSPIGLIRVSPGPRGSDTIRPHRKMMPFSNCCTTRTDRASPIRPATASTTSTATSAASTVRTSSRVTGAAIGPGRVAATGSPYCFTHQIALPTRLVTLGRDASRPGRWAGGDSLHGVSARDTDWDGVRLHVVTGKGGTGKTTVAAALALALASRGRKVLLMEVEGRQGIAQLFDRPPLLYGERKVAVAPGSPGCPGGDVYALAVDPEEALLEYLEMFYNLRRAGRALTRLGVVDFATTIAPGLRDVLLTGKATEAVRRRTDGTNRRYVYDAVVM